MLVKIEDGFYLNSQHVIAVRVSKNAHNGTFTVGVEYTPNSVQNTGLFEKHFNNGVDAEIYLQSLNQSIGKY